LKAFVPRTTAATKRISSGAIHSAAAIMVDLKTGEVIGEHNPDTVVYPASLTKIMTAIVACEMIRDMEDTFTLTNEIINPYVLQGASRANFATGYAITMKELVYGVILPSGADACAALAIKLCGSEAAFVEKMNEKAAAIGCEQTRFVNATGLHSDGHYSTARDMANILSYAMNNPFLRAVLSAESFKTTAPLGNKTAGFYYNMYCIWASRYAGNESQKAEMFAAKTGYTPEAGQCLASVSRTADGKEYVIVTIGARSQNGESSQTKPYKDAKYLLDTYLN
jgi:D-alanyl-D-alanine carboxypeptidase (penicillin-binding protein 5/6)